MATSNQTIYQLTRNQIIESALRKLGVLALGQVPEAEQYTNGQIALNAAVAELQTIGMLLWARKEYSIVLVASQKDYTLGIGQTIATPFPLKIQQARLVDNTSLSVIDMEQKSVYDFNLLPQNSSGQPVSFTYQPFVNYGVVSVWPKPDTNAATNKSLKIVYQRPFEGFTASGETPDFPQEWQNAIIYYLAKLLAPEYGLPIEDRKQLMVEAKQHIDSALSFGNEESSMYWMVDRRN